MTVKHGRGYVPAERNKEEGLPIGVIAIDSVFSPIKRVNFHVENARVGRMTDYDKLTMEIWTDGTISPAMPCRPPLGFCVSMWIFSSIRRAQGGRRLS